MPEVSQFWLRILSFTSPAKRMAMIATVLLGLLIFLGLMDSVVWGRQLSALEKSIIPGASLVERDSLKSLNVSDCPGERVLLY